MRSQGEIQLNKKNPQITCFISSASVLRPVVSDSRTFYQKTLILMTILITILSSSATAFAGVLPWGLTATYLIRWEDDQLDNDLSVGKARLTIKKTFEIGKISITPNIYCEHDSFEGYFLYNDRKETDTGILFDIVAFSNDAVKLTVSPGYEHQDNIGSNDDGLMILQIKADF